MAVRRRPERLKVLLAVSGAGLLLAAGAVAQVSGRNAENTYRLLHPKQQALVKRWVAEYRAVYRRQLDPEAIYNQLPLSARTTFQAVTHALMNSKLTSAGGRPMGTALDLVDVIERVAGEVPGARGDRQFRVYAYLRHGAVERLYASREFRRRRDNTVYHIGYPVNFRQEGGVPSIQISIARTGRRADIDVDYRSSFPLKALVNGHLRPANSDVRAGNNEQTHNGRWGGLSNWWRELMAVFIERAPRKEPEEALAPGVEVERGRLAAGAVHDVIHTYLSKWLIERRPEEILPLFSVKSFPCIAEFGDDSRPDSKMALLRILRRLQQRSRHLPQARDLAELVEPVDYRLPGAVEEKHRYSHLFSLSEVPDDTAWAIDCRVRYNLQMAEAIPRPASKLNKTYVASMRVKNPKDPEAFTVMTWARAGKEWRIVSFELRHKGMSPPELPAIAGPQPDAGGSRDAGEISEEAGRLLEEWLLRKRTGEAMRYFLAESFGCDASVEVHAGKAQAVKADPKNVVAFLEAVAKEAGRGKKLESVVVAVEAGHPDLKPLRHGRSEAFLLAEATGALAAMSACGVDPARMRKRSREAGRGALKATMFRLIQPGDEDGGVVSLYWKKTAEGWRVVSFEVSED